MMKSKKSIRTLSRRVLAIDPGYDRMGVAVIEKDYKGEKIIFSCCISTNPKNKRSERLLHIGNELKVVIKDWKPTEFAAETLFFNQNVTSAIGVAEARGIALYLAEESGLKVYEYSPLAVKTAVTGYGRASKEQVEKMVKNLIKIPSGKRLDDELDAIAIGLTHLSTVRR